MRIGATVPSVIAPVPGAGQVRGDKAPPSPPLADDPDARRTDRALVPVGGPPARAARTRADASAATSLLNAQIIAQGLPAKSERRLARYFPDRAIAAYRHHAALLDEADRKRLRRSA